MKLRRFRLQLQLILVAILASLMAMPVFARENKDGRTLIVVRSGVESLKYEEQSSEHNLKSKATVANIAASAELIGRWDNFIIGFRSAGLIKSTGDREKWSQNNNITQTNRLKYGRTQLTSFVGLPLNGLFNPVLGLKANLSKQHRSDFRDHDGSPIASPKITEELKAYYVLLGFIGTKQLSGKWSISYGAEYDLPFNSEVTNNGLPGWKASDVDGYQWSGHGELLYEINEKFTMGLLLAAGRQHWEASDWLAYDGGQAKWPENDTRFLNSLLSCSWKF